MNADITNDDKFIALALYNRLGEQIDGCKLKFPVMTPSERCELYGRLLTEARRVQRWCSLTGYPDKAREASDAVKWLQWRARVCTN